MPCLAGGTIAVIEPDGGVKLCELKERVGELRKSGYDFRRLLDGGKAEEQRKRIRDDRCRCTHVCFVNMSAGSSLKSVLSLPFHALLALAGK